MKVFSDFLGFKVNLVVQILLCFLVCFGDVFFE